MNYKSRTTRLKRASHVANAIDYICGSPMSIRPPPFFLSLSSAFSFSLIFSSKRRNIMKETLEIKLVNRNPRQFLRPVELTVKMSIRQRRLGAIAKHRCTVVPIFTKYKSGHQSCNFFFRTEM